MQRSRNIGSDYELVYCSKYFKRLFKKMLLLLLVYIYIYHVIKNKSSSTL